VKTAFSMLAGLAMLFALTLAVTAEEKDKKEVTLKGEITCAKCGLKVKDQDTCATVIKVKDGDKDVIYWFDTDSSKKNHQTICKKAMKGEVTGTVEKKDDKNIITVKEVKFAD
jgi:Family of unknown function (DUF6370)